MQTDELLRRIAAIRPTNLLPLFGAADATPVSAESIELTARSVRLDLLLHLRSRTGHEYLHLVEWQGYHKADLLWRTMRYIAELAEQRTQRPILCTIVYLEPESDTGATIVQAHEHNNGRWAFEVDTVRLWEIDAADYTQAAPGLAVLTPLMRGATIDSVLHVAQRVLDETEGEAQGDLLGILSVFSQRFIDPETFIELVGKERLMTYGAITILVNEQVEEKVAQIQSTLQAQREQERAELEAQREQERTDLEAQYARKQAELEAHYKADIELRTALRITVEDVLSVRFPTLPFVAARRLQQVTEPAALIKLHAALLTAPDEAAARALITQAADAVAA